MYSLFHEKIEESSSIFITSHENCPDAIGSMCAIIDFLEKKGKQTYPFLSKPVPKDLKTMQHSEKICHTKPNTSNFDLYLVLDSGDLKQTGLEKKLLKIIVQKTSPVINIDHHKTNDHFGHINIVDKEASSACELVYSLLAKNDYIIQEPIANCLLTGIVADTGNFTNAATTEKSFKIAAELILKGANIFTIIQKLFSTEESINTLRLWGKIFERLTYNKKYDIAVSYVLQKDLVECNAKEESVEIVANLLNYIHGIKAGFLFKEKKNGSFKISMRSNHPQVDVSCLAKILGGGGHRKAAGFSVNKFSLPILD